MHSFSRWLRRRSQPLRTAPPCVEALEGRLLLTAYVVTTSRDALNDTTPGEVTLRDALTALGGTPSGNATVVGTAVNSITFAIPGAGPQPIQVGSDPSALNQPLPAIVGLVFLDGWSQGGAGYAGPPLLVLDGARAGANNGLQLDPGSDGSTVRGLVLQGFGGDAIDVNGTSGNLIVANYLGTDVTGTLPRANARDGILIDQGATANTVGGTTAALANLISAGTTAAGVEISGSGSNSNVLLGNLIGTDITGTAKLTDTGEGVLIHEAATANIVGGTAPGSANLVSGNGTGGDFPFGGSGTQIIIDGVGTSGNVVLGNHIGTKLGATASLAKFVGGLLIEGGATANTVGGADAGAANVISGNANGVEIKDVGTSGNVVLGNLIGTDITGTVALGNSNQGVHIADASANTIGGTVPGAGNVISGNTFVEDSIGLQIVGSGATGNLVVGNRVGTDITGTKVLPNSFDGIGISAPGNTVGGTTPASANLISGNGPGVELGGNESSGNVVLGNLIGTDIHGTAALGGDEGILVRSGATGNTIGGTAAGSANVISGNGRFGVEFTDGAFGNVLLGNLIGTDIHGTGRLGNGGAGVNIDFAMGNTVGGTAAGAANVISANGNGISISGTGTSGNVILGNLIGTDLSGTAPLGNQGPGLYLISESSANTIGGTGSGAANVISANGDDGVDIAGFANSYVVLGNLIGTDIHGTAALGNAGNGIVLGNDGNTIGGSAANVISANGGSGVAISSSNATGNFVLGNFIGTDINGTAPLGNTIDGVILNDGATANTIGSAAGVNVISANGQNGVEIANPGTDANLVGSNFIGTDVTGTAALGNGLAGVVIRDGARRNVVGRLGGGNLISANGLSGVEIAEAGTSGNVVLSNFIGTDRLGTSRLGNADDGVLIHAGATGNTVGGPAFANLISANSNAGVHLADAGTSGNLVVGNLIGTDLNGTGSLGNVDGVLVSDGASANTVGGTGLSDINVISANTNGVEIDGLGTAKNVVLGNLIGTDVSGTAAPFGNFNEGVLIGGGATGNIIGGTEFGAGNVISGGQKGVEIASEGTSGNLVAGNAIGTDSSGTAALPNFDVGVEIISGATGNTVGGTTLAASNVISANGVAGVHIAGSPGGGPTSGNVVLGNLIGTDFGGTAQLGNGDGVLIELGATRNTIGGTARGSSNLIAFNTRGVVVLDASTTGISILGNSIFGNAGPGIDLGGDGVTPNGANPRAAPNRGQNTPVITLLRLTSVSGSLRSVARTRFRLEFFATPANGSPPQGQIFLGALTVTTSAAGLISFTAPVTTIPPGTVITATATNLTTGDTSEFSALGTQLLITSSLVIPPSSAAQVVTLSAQLFAAGVAVTGAKVKFRIAGLPGSVTGIVNSNGVVTVRFVLPAGTRPGTYSIIASFLGTGEIAGAVADALLSITVSLKLGGRRWVR
jgi:hypothetical protein